MFSKLFLTCHFSWIGIDGQCDWGHISHPEKYGHYEKTKFDDCPTQIYGVNTSLTQSECIRGTPGEIDMMWTQQSMSATNQIYGALPSSFVDFNVQMDRNESHFH